VITRPAEPQAQPLEGHVWAGEAAVVVASDSIFIDIFLTNQVGGTAAGHWMGPLLGTKFYLSNPGYDALSGSVADGRLSMHWTLHRDWGEYEGPLMGRRK
jgi:hypothetical protein